MGCYMLSKTPMRIAALSLILAACSYGQNSVTAGRLHLDRPTLENLGFWWSVSGDANRNGKVDVEYKLTGETVWRRALPLLRIGGEQIGRDHENLKYIVPEGFAGSILNLKPGTEYDVRLTLSDPDGASGETGRTFKMRTRTEPQAYAGGRTLHVYSPEYKGPRQEPAFTGILEAYYGAGLGDWSVGWEQKAKPGDTLLVLAGLYRPERLNYVDPLAAPFDGTFNLTLKGTAEKPITIKAAGDGEVVFDGAGNHVLFDVIGTSHHIFDGLTFRNTDVAMLAGKKELAGAVNLTVRNCRFENVGFGIWTEYAGSREFYISDNLFLGRDDRYRLVGWTGPRWGDIGPYSSHLLTSYYAIKVYGPGHIIARNAIAYFHDGIGISTYGTPEADPDRQAAAIDIYNNDLHMLNDDFIETDGGVRNIRVYRNRGVNAFHGGYSSQPIFGGPVYFFRNLLYHVQSGVAFKLDARPAGLLIYHNTLIGEQAVRSPNGNAHWRNNLFLGRDTPGRGIMTWANATGTYSSDYNGFRPNKGIAAQYSWLAPTQAGETLYYNKPEHWKSFRTLAELNAMTNQEKHGIEVDFDIFERMAPPDPAPAKRHAVYHAMDLDFRLKAQSRAIDAGQRLPTINDGFSGAGPDLGALETGQPLPHYGPRWINWQPFYR
jgi:hypothetical protein